MKFTTSLAFACLIATTSIITSCGDNAPKGDEAKVEEKKETADATGAQYAVDTTSSKVRFNGFGVGKNHPGVFKLSSGSLAVANNQITGGNFVINIKSMDLEQKGGMFDSKLRPHLMSPDFFDAEKYGTAKFEITSVQPYTKSAADTSVIDGANYTVSGNLTLKDTTKNVSFPAKIDMDSSSVKAKSNFDIDRTTWGMRYGNDKKMGDKFISEKVNIQLDLEAKKQ